MDRIAWLKVLYDTESRISRVVHHRRLPQGPAGGEGVTGPVRGRLPLIWDRPKISIRTRQKVACPRHRGPLQATVTRQTG